MSMSSRRQAGLGQRVIEVARRDRRRRSRGTSRLLVAQPGVDDHRPRAADEQRPHRQRDAVRSSGGALRRPQRLRHDAEHRAAVEPEEAVEQRDQLEVAERETRIDVRSMPRLGGSWLGAVAATASARPARRARSTGWMNATSAPSAPGRGCSSISRDAARLQLRQRRVDVVDAQRDVVQPGAALLDDTSRSASRAPSPRAVRGCDSPTGHEVRAHALRRARPPAPRPRGPARRDRTPAPPRGPSTAMPT